MRRKSQLVDKLKKFYTEIEILRKYLKRGTRYRMSLQTDQKFNQNEIKEINKKHDVEHYNTKLNVGHAVGAEQKIRDLKDRHKNFKRIIKQNKKSRLKRKRALKKATKNMNLQTTLKYGLPPNEAEKKLVESEEYKLDYDFCRLKKTDETSGKYLRNDTYIESERHTSVRKISQKRIICHREQCQVKLS